MLVATSRYVNVPVASLRTTRNGLPVEVRYLTRRFIPERGSPLGVVEYSVKQGDRLDNISARFLGDPTQYWRLCDFNVVLRPTELTATTGMIIGVALALPGAR